MRFFTSHLCQCVALDVVDVESPTCARTHTPAAACAAVHSRLERSLCAVAHLWRWRWRWRAACTNQGKGAFQSTRVCCSILQLTRWQGLLWQRMLHCVAPANSIQGATARSSLGRAEMGGSIACPHPSKHDLSVFVCISEKGRIAGLCALVSLMPARETPRHRPWGAAVLVHSRTRGDGVGPLGAWFAAWWAFAPSPSMHACTPRHITPPPLPPTVCHLVTQPYG